MTNNKRERRKIIHKLEFDFYVIEIEKEYFKGQKSIFALNVQRNKNREFSINKPYWNYSQEVKKHLD